MWPRRPLAAGIIVVTVVFGALFARVPWPYVDLYNTLQQAETLSWAETFRYAFTNGADFRPVMTIATKAAYSAFGLRLWAYKAIVLVEFAALLWLLVTLWQPVGWRRTLAAGLGLACLVGLHTSRTLFLFLPLNGGSVAMSLLVCASILSLSREGRTFQWWFLPLTLFSLLLLEFGVLILPIVIVAWWLSAPGVTRRAVLAAFGGAAIYFVVRQLIGAPVGELWATESGLGFDDVPPHQLKAIFQHAPWLFWTHNVGASLLTVLLSEPRAGKFKFVSAALRGAAGEWQWLHVVSSLLTTCVVVGVLAMARNVAARDRVLAAIGVVLLLGGSALGFLYTRDRIAMPAGLGYAILVYVTVSLLLERASATRLRQALAVGVVGVLGVCWTFRTIEAGLQLRDRAWDYYLEWTVRYHHEGPESPLLTALRRTVVAHRPPDPRRDTAWTYRWFERQFERVEPR